MYPNLDLKLFYCNKFTQGLSPEFIQFNWKVITNVVYTREKLFNYGLIDTNKCSFCDMYTEDVRHLLLTCPHVKPFLEYVNNLVQSLLRYESNAFINNFLFDIFMLFGYTNRSKKSNSVFINALSSIARLTIYKVRNLKIFDDRNVPFKSLFTLLLKRHIMHAATVWGCKSVKFNKYVMQLNPHVKLDENDQVKY